MLLARHLPLGMAEAGRLLPVSLAPLGLPWSARLPVWSADPHVIAFCHSLVVGFGGAAALVLLRRLLNGRRWQLAGLAAALLLAAGGRWLIAA